VKVVVFLEVKAMYIYCIVFFGLVAIIVRAFFEKYLLKALSKRVGVVEALSVV
jgi:hypothetical protein